MAISRMQEPRQLYGLGSLVKKITRPIKKVLKSPIGKAAALGLGGYALGGGFGAGGFKFGNIPGFTAGKNFLFGSPLGYKTASGSVARSSGLFSKLKGLSGSTKGILGLGAGAGLLGGLFAKQEDETEEEYQARIEQLGPYLKQYYSNVGDTFGDQAVSPGEVEDFVTSQSIEYQGAKDGGIIGKKKKEKDKSIKEKILPKKKKDKGREMRSGMTDPVSMLDQKGGDDEEMSETLIMVEGKKDGGIMNLGGKEMDLRSGGFVPLGKKERADDVPARLSKNEFVFTADAVRAAGGGSVKKGAQKMYDTMKSLENRIR